MLADLMTDMPRWLPIAAATVAVLGFVYLGTFGQVDKENSKADLDRLDDYETPNMISEREANLQKPLFDRMADGVTSRLGGAVRRFTPTGYIDGMKEKMLLTGKSSPDSVERFLAVRVITAFLALPGFYLAYKGIGGSRGFMSGALVLFACVAGPDAVVNRRVAERQSIIRNSLPDLLDLLTISVEAGLGFEQALARTVDQVPGPLSDEFRRMLAEIRTGASRAESLRALDRRTGVEEVRSFVLAILQADTFGVSIARVLRVQSEEMRIKRRQLAQEKAQKAPVKMLIPMVFCVFPAVFVVVIGPAVINIRKNF